MADEAMSRRRDHVQAMTTRQRHPLLEQNIDIRVIQAHPGARRAD
jgi:hypothetical protein